MKPEIFCECNITAKKNNYMHFKQFMFHAWIQKDFSEGVQLKSDVFFSKKKIVDEG